MTFQKTTVEEYNDTLEGALALIYPYWSREGTIEADFEKFRIIMAITKYGVIDAKQREVAANALAFREMLADLLVIHKGKFALLRSRKLISLFPHLSIAIDSGAAQYPDGFFSVEKVTDEVSYEVGAAEIISINNDGERL